MGTIIPPPIIPPFVPAGSLCSVCWGIGKTFGVDDTPSIIQVSFSGVNLGEGWRSGDGAPIDGIFEVEQSFAPCLYQSEISGIWIDINWTTTSSTVVATRKFSGLELFHCTNDNICDLEFKSTLADHWLGGSALITILETH